MQNKSNHKTTDMEAKRIEIAKRLQAEYLALGATRVGGFVESLLIKCLTDPDIFFALIDAKSAVGIEEQLAAIAKAASEAPCIAAA